MQINFTIYATGTIITTNKLRYIAYQADTPTAAVATITEDPPHTFPHPVTMNVPNPVPHIVKIYSTPDASTGTLLSEFLYDPTYTNVQVRSPLQIVVGGPGPYDPADGSREINIPDAVGWTYYPERRSNAGTMADYEYSILPTGGISLSDPDDIFEQGELLWVHFEPQISTSTPVFNYLNLFNDIVTIDHSITIDSSYYGKLIEVASTTTAITITLPKLADMPDLKTLFFQTMMGNQKQTSFVTQSGEPIKLFNGDRTAVFLGQCDHLQIIKKGNAFHIISVSPSVYQVGMYVYADSILPNSGWCDGGGMPIADYPRVDAYLDTLPPGVVLTKTFRDNGGEDLAAYWAREGGMIYRPDRRGLTIRALPGDRGNDPGRTSSSLPGSYEADEYESHVHAADNDNSNINFIIRREGGPGANLQIPAGGGGWELKAAITALSGGAETRGKNDGRVPLVLF